MLEHVQAIGYVTPLREGGSLPGIVEAGDDGTSVVKLRGAGQGLKVLVVEVIVGPNVEQPEPAGVARPDVGHRPRGRPDGIPPEFARAP